MKKDNPSLTLPKIKSNKYFPFGFHLSKKAKDKYNLDEELLLAFAQDIDLSDADAGWNLEDLLQDAAPFKAVRLIAQRINEKRDLRNYPDDAVKAGQLNLLVLINEIFRFVVNDYQKQKNPFLFKNGIEWVTTNWTTDVTNQTIIRFIELFPPYFVKARVTSELAISEIVLLFLSNNNPAFLPFIDLFDDADLYKNTSYEVFICSFINFSKTQPVFGPYNQPIIDLLKSPIIASPNSLIGQLEYIRNNWEMLLPAVFMRRIFLAIDLITEEEKIRFAAPDSGVSLVPHFVGHEYEIELENFSRDLDWMSNVVLMAKNIYVWLDQLSKKYNQKITKLDQIPDEELDILAKWGFTGLWFIGLWERSSASQKIKQICGNPEAIASAYSLYDYVIADDLGGNSAFENLKYRAWQRGIRLASDMVPNHTGIYSKWIIEHPEWFIQLDYSPFPSHNFTNHNLSDNNQVTLYIEDGYWTRSDAAVVFKRIDNYTGDVKYIYHGNDGTSMPWNDTAQLNFLLQEVREAVIQTILHVARMFPIIRFDAAMTLTKKHFQRLWFPTPGSGGDIPSRAGQGLSKNEFDKLFPKEFWREVVDRVALEVPDTLLLAEAFWLMEGYFVRTLGMHRVYNSAFMNMLKMEENANYRSVIKNVLEYDPQILKRFVNFMNNPDEQTAIAQFGKGDKYFGVAIMMVTMPGLPMFGHGQIQGFSEKYGMEYRKAYWNEDIDLDLVYRHEQEIFPLMRKRHLFSDVQNFALYDFYTSTGYVNEDVFAYSNRTGNEMAIILYNNRYSATNGCIHYSTPISIGITNDERRLMQKTLAHALDIKIDDNIYYTFKDYKTGLEYIRHSKEIAEKGLYVELGAYQYHILLDFKGVYDNGCYAHLSSILNGSGVPNIEEMYKEIYYEPVFCLFKEIMNKNLSDISNQDIQVLFSKIKEFEGGTYEIVKITSEIMGYIKAICRMQNIEYEKAIDLKRGVISKILLVWLIVLGLQRLDCKEQSITWLMIKALIGSGVNEENAKKQFNLVKILIKYRNWFESSAINDIFDDMDVQKYLNFNWHEGTLWLSKELLEEMMSYLWILSVVNDMYDAENEKDNLLIEMMSNRYDIIEKILICAEDCGYRVQEMQSHRSKHTKKEVIFNEGA